MSVTPLTWAVGSVNGPVDSTMQTLQQKISALSLTPLTIDQWWAASMTQLMVGEQCQ
jgi:hypothetical protein